ncbi:MAG: IclR family transcriptional regulator [Actinomycetes bacterium]|jgi:IclR family acetate operon transcriptional repressor
MTIADEPSGVATSAAGSADRYTVGSVARALAVLELIASGPADGMSVSDIARALGTSKSTAFSLVRTLVTRGFLRDVDPGPRYQLGMALVRLGDDASRALPLGRVCEPVLVELSRDTGLTTRAAISDGGYPIFIARIDSPGAVRFHTALGVRELPHTSSAGKAILAMMPGAEVAAVVLEAGLPRRTRKTLVTLADLEADLELTRERGYAIDDEEDFEGVFCAAAAFFDHSARVAGAISATGIKLDLSPQQIEALGQSVRTAADRVTDLIGGVRPRIGAN